MTTQFLETEQSRVLKYPVLWKEAVVRVGGLNSTPTLFGNHALKLWIFVPSGHTSQLHLTVLRPRRKTFPNKQGTPGVWLQKEGEAISHCLKWYRHWAPFCISLVAKKGISNKNKDISKPKSLFWGTYICFSVPSFQGSQSLLTYSQVSPTIDFTLKPIIRSCIFAFHFLIILSLFLKMLLKILILNFLYPSVFITVFITMLGSPRPSINCLTVYILSKIRANHWMH